MRQLWRQALPRRALPVAGDFERMTWRRAHQLAGSDLKSRPPGMPAKPRAIQAITSVSVQMAPQIQVTPRQRIPEGIPRGLPLSCGTSVSQACPNLAGKNKMRDTVRYVRLTPLIIFGGCIEQGNL